MGLEIARLHVRRSILIQASPGRVWQEFESFESGFERLGSEAADHLAGYEEGWDIKHLKALRSIVEGC